MAEILGLTVSDFPFLRMKPASMPWVLQGNLGWGWRYAPQLWERANWPAEMQAEWGDDQDQGTTAGARHQQRQIEQFGKLREALDDFAPHLILLLYRDVQETFQGAERPRYWIHAHDAVECQPYKLFGFFRDNYFEEDPDKVEILRGHPQAALHLATALDSAGLAPKVVRERINPEGLGHNALGTAIHLDWQRREYATPILPLAIDPFRFDRKRDEEGLSPWDRNNPNPPLPPAEAFALGQEIARAYRDSPWRVAVVAGVDWSHANDADKAQLRIHPDVQADAVRFEQWRTGDFQHWGDDWTFEEMEAHAQWELLVTIVLAGAMSEIGAPVAHADFQPTWVCNDNFVTTIFEPR